MHAAWNHSMQSFSHCTAFSSSCTSLLHAPHGYFAMHISRKDLKRIWRGVDDKRTFFIPPCFSSVLNDVVSKYTEKVLVPFLTGALHLIEPHLSFQPHLQLLQQQVSSNSKSATFSIIFDVSSLCYPIKLYKMRIW